MHHHRRLPPRPLHARARTLGRAQQIDAGIHVVADGEAGTRLDVLVARLADAPRSLVAQALREGHILLNGAPPKASATLAAGDEIAFEVPKRAALEAVAQAIPLDIVFEDGEILVVDKPAGMVTHPAHGARDGTLVNALLAHAGALPGDPLRPGLVHRLDRDTSGLLVVAKTPDALATLGTAMRRRTVEREYLGLVAGIPDQDHGTIAGSLARDPRQRLKFAVRAEGRHAVTHFEIRERLNAASELLFTLETGRTHQIRVHMAAYGHPVIGDTLYGRRDHRVTIGGQALHAWRLRFHHPGTGELLAFEVPPPAAYVRARDALRE